VLSLGQGGADHAEGCHPPASPPHLPVQMPSLALPLLCPCGSEGSTGRSPCLTAKALWHKPPPRVRTHLGHKGGQLLLFALLLGGGIGRPPLQHGPLHFPVALLSRAHPDTAMKIYSVITGILFSIILSNSNREKHRCTPSASDQAANVEPPAPAPTRRYAHVDHYRYAHVNDSTSTAPHRL
jgi:hypothetical protein